MNALLGNVHEPLPSNLSFRLVVAKTCVSEPLCGNGSFRLSGVMSQYDQVNFTDTVMNLPLRKPRDFLHLLDDCQLLKNTVPHLFGRLVIIFLAYSYVLNQGTDAVDGRLSDNSMLFHCSRESETVGATVTLSRCFCVPMN
jgi:hypothetical protein